MNIEQQTVLTDNSESALAVPVVESAPEATQKRVYTKKEDMQRGNDAILATLPEGEEGALNKAQIFAKLNEADRELVTRNWNLRIALLEETQQVLTKGNKVAKKYFRAA